MWQASVLTLFPEMFPGPLGLSLSGKGLENKVWSLTPIQIRDFTTDKHRSVDDTCYGPNAGMIMKPDVIDRAFQHAVDTFAGAPHILYMSPRGTPLKQKTVHTFSKSDGIIILCGRYEGVDDRVIEYWRESRGLQEVSVGDYVLSGGEVAAFALIDACVRLLPGVVSNERSLDYETFELDLLEFPQYTRPCVWREMGVPEILLSGDHGKIAQWQRKEAERITEARRPDLWEEYLGRNCGENGNCIKKEWSKI